MAYKDPEKRKAYQKAWREANKDKLKEYHKAYSVENIDKIMDYHYQRRYGITLAQSDKMKAYGCAICGSHHKLAIDHDHITGEVRGVLCNNCNLGLGKLGDSIDGLERAIAYLKGNA